MWLIYFGLMGAIIPEGWPMFRANQQRTGYISGIGCFKDSAFEKWSLLIQDSESDIIFSSPVSADFVGDNHKDVLIGSWGPGFFPTADLYNGDNGAVMWVSDYSGEGPMFNAPALMEITGDNKPEVFLQEIENVYRFRSLNGTNGTGVWANNNIDSVSYCAPLVLEEIYGAGGRIIVGDDGGKLWVLNATTGDSIWTYTVGKYIQPASFGDVDNDGNSEIVVVAGTMLYVFNLNGGAPKWSMNMNTDATTPALVNLDGDAQLEITVYNYTAGRVRSYNCGTSTPFIDVSVGVWTDDFTPGATMTSITWPPSPGLADITNDGNIDIVIHNGVNLSCINGATHLVEWSNPARHLFGSPVIANLDNSDIELEIVVTGQPPDPNYRCKVQCFEHTGASKWSWYNAIGTGEPDPSLNEACLTDVDNDGYLEIVAVDYSCFLVCLDCEPSGVEESIKSVNKVSILTPIMNNSVQLVMPGVKKAEYKVYDIMGRNVCEGRQDGLQGKLTIDVSMLEAGIYFLKVNTGAGKLTFKVLKLL